MENQKSIGEINLTPQQEIDFDNLYDEFISITDTQELINNISVESLEAFLYQTAKYFYGMK